MSISNTLTGLGVGLFLGLAAAAGGWPGFLVALVLGAIGLGVGRWLDGTVDLDALTGRDRDRDRDERTAFNRR